MSKKKVSDKKVVQQISNYFQDLLGAGIPKKRAGRMAQAYSNWRWGKKYKTK